MTHMNPIHPDALMLQLLRGEISSNLGLEVPSPEGLDCGGYQFSWGQIREWKIPVGTDTYIVELAVTFSLGEEATHEQERNFLIQTYASQHLLPSLKDKGFEILEPEQDKHFRFRVGEEFDSNAELSTHL